MKKKIITALTLVFALSLALTVYALNRAEVSPKRAAKADCCAKKDSCPMKNKQAAADEKASCCDKDDCCCKGDSCPMKMNGEKTEGKDCCGKGGDSCPLKKDAEKQTTAAATSMDMTGVTVAASDESCCKPGADCCKNGGSCCKGKHDKK